MKSRLTLPLLVALTIGGYGVGIHGSVPDVPTGQWMPGASLAQPREGAVSVALRDGRVLIIGGRTAAGPVGTVESLNPDGSLTVLHSMSLPRGGHTAVRLADDRVLVVGGTTTISSDQGTTEAATASVEIFSPGADTWTAGPALNVARTGQTMAILLDGRVLIAGGAGDQGPLDSIEVFDPDSGTFRVAGVLSTARADAAAAVAGLSQVVVAGGRNADGVLATADLIDLDSGSAAQVMLTSPRANASATALLDGLVLVAGGNDGSNDLATAEVIDPVTGASTAVGSMSQPRSGHHAALLDHNATVLVAGGTSNGAVVATTETFIPWVGQFAAANSPAQPRTNAIVASTSTEGVAVLAAGRTDNGSLPGGTELYGFATVKTDRDDYAPGTPVVITGTGWQPGEIVHLLLHEVGTGEPDVPLIATADANGAIVNDVWAPDEHDLGVRFFLTATGAASQAQATFTDNLNTATISIATLTSAGPPAVCGSAQTTFAGGDSICASVQVTFNGNAPFRVQWYAPGATVGTTAPARDIGFGSPAASPSTVTDSLTTNGTTPTGSWTVVVCDGNTAGTCTPANKVKASQTFTLNAAATSSVTFDALPIADVAPATQVLSVTIGSGSATAVTKAELPKTFSGIAAGTNVSYSYLSPVASTTAGKRYRWSSASGSGSAPGSPAQSGSFAVSANSTVTANYLAQFQLTFAQSGIGADTTGTVVTVAGNAKTAAQLPFSDFFDTGASVSYAYADPVASTVSGKRYALTTPPPSPASPLTVGAAATITGTYKVQFQFTFSQTGIGADSTGTVVTVAGAAKTAAQLPFTTDWLDSGSSLTYVYGDPVASTVSGKRYVLTSPSSSPITVTVTSAAAVSGTYKTQFLVTFAQSGIGGDSVGTVVTVESASKVAADLPFGQWFDSGVLVTYAFSTPVAANVSTKRYVLSSPAPAPASGFAVSTALTITGTYKTQYEVTFTQNGIGGDTIGTVVTVDGSAKTAAQLPFVQFFDSGVSIPYVYADPVASTTSGKRYALTSPAPAPTSPVTVSGASTVTGTYKVQYQVTFLQAGLGNDATGVVLTVNGNGKTFGDLPFTTDWLDSGTNLVYAYSDPVASTISGKRYALTSPAPSPASPIAVSGPVTVTGTYKIQFALTFAQSGMIGDSTGTVVTVDGSPKAEALLPSTEWFDNGSLVSYSFSDPVATSVAGKRYALTTPAASPASPVSVSGAVTITGSYKTQYQLTFTQSGIGADSTGTVVTVDGSPKTAAELPFSDFFDSGASVAYTYGDPVNSSIAGKRYTLTAPAPVPASPIGVSGAATVTATYKTQYQATFAQSGIGADATGDIVTVDGNPKAYGQLPFVEWFDVGNTVNYMYADPVASAVSGKRYSLATPTPSPASPVTIAGPVTVTGTYKTQYFLTFAQSGIGNDSTGTVVTVDGSAKAEAALPFSDWFDDGSNVSYAFSDPVATSVAGKRYTLTAPAASPASPITVSAAATITGTYKTQFLLTFDQTGIGVDSTGTVATVNGGGKTAAQLPFSDWFDSGSSVPYVFGSPVPTSVAGKRYVLTAPAPTPASPITVSGAATITGAYKTQFQVTFAKSGIGADSTGTVVTVDGSAKTAGDLPFATDWLDSGTIVTYFYADPVATSVTGKRYVLTAPAPSPASPVTVISPLTITGAYKTQYLLTFAQAGIGPDSMGTVVTVDGAPKAAAALPFSQWFDAASSAAYAFSDPVATSVAEKRYALTTPAPSPSSPITVSGPATITGTYKIQYLISFGQVGIGSDSTATVVTVNASAKLASVLPFSDWFDSGSTVSYLYSDPVATSVTGKRYALTTPAAAPSSPIAVAGPLSIVGTYKTQFLVTFAQSGIGSPDIGSNPVVKVAGADKTKAVLPFSSWYDQNATVAYSFYTPISTAPVSDKQYELTNSASLPSSPHTVTGAITITGQYAIATYSILYHQPIDQSAGGGLVVNTGKNGRVIPVKIEFFKNGASVQSGTVLMKVNGSPCSGGTPTDLVTEYADAGNSNGNTNLFRWNVGTPGFWIYNLDTGALGLQTNACYRLDVYLNATTGSNAVLLSSSTFALFKPVK